MTVYPLAIDTSADIPTVTDAVSAVNAQTVNRLRDAIFAIETELGVKPSGIYGTVKENLETLSSDMQTVITNMNDAIAAFTGSGAIFIANGDLSGNGASQVVVGIQGVPVSATAPTNQQVLVYDGATWVPGTVNSFVAAGDLSGNNTTQTVVSLTGSGGIVTTTAALTFGAIPATSGDIRLSSSGGNGEWLSFSYNGGTTYPALQLGSGQVILGDVNFVTRINGAALTLYAASSPTYIYGTGVLGLTLNASGLQIGAGAVDLGGGVGVIGIDDAGTVPTTNPTGGVVLYSESGILKYRNSSGSITSLQDSASLPAELFLVSGLFTTTSTSLTRAGARKIDMGLYPATIGSLTRTVIFVADVDMTSGATSVEVQLYDTTHGVVVTGTDLTSTSISNAVVSATLTVGSSSGNLRDDVASQYEVQFKMNGGGGSDAVFITNSRVTITYA